MKIVSHEKLDGDGITVLKFCGGKGGHNVWHERDSFPIKSGKRVNGKTQYLPVCLEAHKLQQSLNAKLRKEGNPPPVKRIFRDEWALPWKATGKQKKAGGMFGYG
jgi:hypothetical protein